MLGPFAITLDVLANSASAEAVALLVEALDSPHESISLAAALALSDRPGMQGQIEVLRRLPQRPLSFLVPMQARSERFDAVLRQSLIQGSAAQRGDALAGVLALHAAEQIPQLIQLLSQGDPGLGEQVADCLRRLISLLDEDVRATSATDASRNAVTARRDRALLHLEQALEKLEAIPEKDVVIESILALGPLSHSAVKKVLWQASPDCRERAGWLLLTSTHPKVMRQAIDSLRQSYPHPKAFEAVQSRTDVEFFCELLRALPTKPGSMFEQNLRQFEHLAWFESSEPPFDLIPPDLQPALLALAYTTKIPLARKVMVQDWLLRHGGPAGRMAAAERAAGTDENVMQHVLIDSLDAEDEQVQAWAVTQLRQHAVPEAFAHLIQRLDSPSAGVRAAVRQELSDFNLDRVLGLIDALDAATSMRVGEILRKIDDHVAAGLERELFQAIRPRRIRAAKAVVKLGFLRELLPQLLKLADDEDFMLRRTLAEVLDPALDADVPPVLDRLTRDAHPRVRDAATHALARCERKSDEQLDPVLMQ